MAFFPISVAIRAQGEGWAAWQVTPLTVMMGHAAFMGTIIISGCVFLRLEALGY